MEFGKRIEKFKSKSKRGGHDNKLFMSIKKRKFILGSFAVFVLGIMPFVANAGSFRNPLADPKGADAGLGVGVIVGRIVSGTLGIAGVLATLFIILGAIKLMIGFSQGAEDKIKQGKNTLVLAIVGLVVAFGGYLIINAVIERTGFLVGQDTTPAMTGGR